MICNSGKCVSEQGKAILNSKRGVGIEREARGLDNIRWNLQYSRFKFYRISKENFCCIKEEASRWWGHSFKI